ncbi:P-type DNA transfer ATPase VirB11 [Phenylobacterium montanum]|uniref:P-type DNA transfer ATPase VirB11 n=1 Tax=Phenylobacterium montanum TaxID=2823693 RepID=A0A975IXB4_9CAUL|nr:P-type DNA transfer ATPase VirB11 [Caulobacter sp. S6]
MVTKVGAYLEAYLRPLAPWLEREDITDIFINRPGELWAETLGGGCEHHAEPDLTEVALWRLATQIAAATHQGVSREHPLVAATLPGGARVQIVAPPATRGPLAMAIRKQVVRDLSIGDYAAAGAFAAAMTDADPAASTVDDALAALLAKRDLAEFLALAVRARKNILISGGTSTGKTTFLNALLKEVPAQERLITIEDTPEVRTPHANAIGLIAVRGEQGEARVTVEDLLQASLRLRPDRIILGELRGAEAFSFLRAVNSGHPGSITTVHADSPAAAIDQIALMVLQSGANLGRAEIGQYVRGVIDIAVQLGRVDGRRIVSQVTFRRGPEA